MVIRTKRQYEEALADLETLKGAWRKAVNAQSYAIGDRQLERPGLKELRREIDEMEVAIDAYETGSGKRRAKRIIPI